MIWLAAALLAVQPGATAIERGVLPSTWLTAASCPEPPFRVHEYNSDFYILRQSGCTNFEKPFLYLIFGRERVLLVDTGASGADVRPAIDDVMHRWSQRAGHAVALSVIHSHQHGDHIAGDQALRGRNNVLFEQPRDGTLDLGGRVVDMLRIPGHEPASIALYDRRTGILLTGDTLYPGRLYVRDQAAFRKSIERLVSFTADKTVTHVLGAHIENTRTPYADYPKGTKFQPDEHVLELGRAHLLELNAALKEMPGGVTRKALRDFTIWPIEK
jgi:glyoxylase-like metal-dependent hydrolase (beta-lactamase superfamily II)